MKTNGFDDSSFITPFLLLYYKSKIIGLHQNCVRAIFYLPKTVIEVWHRGRRRFYTDWIEWRILVWVDHDLLGMELDQIWTLILQARYWVFPLSKKEHLLCNCYFHLTGRCHWFIGVVWFRAYLWYVFWEEVTGYNVGGSFPYISHKKKKPRRDFSLQSSLAISGWWLAPIPCIYQLII